MNKSAVSQSSAAPSPEPVSGRQAALDTCIKNAGGVFSAASALEELKPEFVVLGDEAKELLLEVELNGLTALDQSAEFLASVQALKDEFQQAGIAVESIPPAHDWTAPFVIDAAMAEEAASNENLQVLVEVSPPENGILAGAAAGILRLIGDEADIAFAAVTRGNPPEALEAAAQVLQLCSAFTDLTENIEAHRRSIVERISAGRGQ